MVRRVATNTRLKLTHSDSGIYKGIDFVVRPEGFAPLSCSTLVRVLLDVKKY